MGGFGIGICVILPTLSRMIKRSFSVTFMSFLMVVGIVASTPSVGDRVPDFSMVDTEGRSHLLSEHLKKGPVVIAFFPKAFTSG